MKKRFWKHLKSMACADKLFPDMEALVASVERNLVQQNDFQSDSRFTFYVFKELFVRYLVRV